LALPNIARFARNGLKQKKEGSYFLLRIRFRCSKENFSLILFIIIQKIMMTGYTRMIGQRKTLVRCFATREKDQKPSPDPIFLMIARASDNN